MESHTVPSDCGAIMSAMSTLVERVPAPHGEEPDVATEAPRVVLCGSFRRDVAGLRATFAELIASGCELLSPGSVDFVAVVDGFAMTSLELDEDPSSVEARHIAAIRAADLVWLHSPAGYVGPSAALEVGIAHSLDIPIYAATSPADPIIAQFVTIIDSPRHAVDVAWSLGTRTPASPLRDLQIYYERVAALRGFERESPQDTMLLLTEEVGELARAIRKRVGLTRAGANAGDPAAELADVQLYVLHLANVIGVDLAGAVAAKEQVNHARYGKQAA
jgi:NTP pyrophosphatase (non-canonical NTP hydrolase)